MALAKKLEEIGPILEGDPVSPRFQHPKMPRHVAIIMDGNRRWAKAHGLPAELGHYRGAEAARRTVEAAREMGIPYLTLFGFSSENWNRSEEEIAELMVLLRQYLQKEVAPLAKANVRLKIIGDRSRLQPGLIEEILAAERRTSANTGLQLTIAFSYGGRSEIASAVRQIAEQVKNGELAPEAITETTFAGFLLTADMPDPDLIIRTSGERRLSNFLLWQSAYAEFVFMDTMWPDFGSAELHSALSDFVLRERRYGAVG